MSKALFISLLLLILVTCSGMVLAYPTYWWGGFSGASYSDENGNPIYTTEQWGVVFWVEVSPGLYDPPTFTCKWYDPHGNRAPPTTKGRITGRYFYVAGIFMRYEGYFYIYEEERELGLYRVECYAGSSLLFTDYFQICTNPSFQVNINGAIFNVTILSNSTITSFNYSKTEKKITFNVTGPDGRLGFCNVTIPNALFDAPPEEWRVLVDNKAVDANMTPINATHTALYFTYFHTTHEVTIMEPDTTPPVTVNDYVVNAWYVAGFTITLTATDYESGVAETYYRINDGPIQSVSIHGQPRITTEGASNKLEYWSADNAGNEELPHKILTGIKLDKTPPTGTIVINNNDVYASSISVTLTLTATDATSGVYQVRFSNDGVWDTEPWEIPSLTKTWTLTSGDETKTVYYQIKDNAGLVSSTHSDTIILDTAPPTGSIIINEKETYTNSISVTLTLSAEDITSGIGQMRFSNDNITWTPWEAYSTSKTWALITGDGTKTVYVQYRDKAGLTSPTYKDTIVLDTTKPTAIAGPDQTVNEDTLVTFNGSASWDENGIASYTWTFTDITPQTLTDVNPTYTLQTPGIYTVTLKVTDAAGNYATDTVTITVLDITKPVANAGPDQTVNEDAPVSLDGSASHDNVGITAYTWTFTDVTPKTLTEEKPTYIFDTPGVYTVTLNVVDAAGNWATDTVVITVLDVTKPLANAGQDKKVNVGETVTFDAGASTDNVAIASYEWEFGDGTTGTGKTTTHAYEKPGTYKVTLTVKDAAGNAATHSITITVAEAFPTWIAGVVIAAVAVIIGAVFAMRKRKPKA